VLVAYLVEKRRQEAVQDFGLEEKEVGNDTLTENMKGSPCARTSCFFWKTFQNVHV